MITKNLKNLMLGYLCNYTSNVPLVFETGIKSNASVNNYAFTPSKLTTTGSSAGQVACFLGGGTTKETENDYKLETEYFSDFTKDSFVLSQNLNHDLDVKNVNIRYIATFTNNTSSAKTVSEIGLYWWHSNYRVLLYRETFEPVTIASGETKTFTIVLS